MFSKGEGMAGGKTLDFFQIYYEDWQQSKMYSFATPYKNETLTPYFENSVIAELVPKSNADLIGVCSWRLKEKREDMFALKDKSLSYEKIVNAEFDVAVLTPRSNSHKALQMASIWHGQAWNDALNDLRNFIKIPKEVTKAIYENHFIATRDVYHSYVDNCLIPCMDYCHNRPVYMADSGYARRKSPEEVASYRSKTARQDYPIAPFILERLFSIWIEGKGFKVINL